MAAAENECCSRKRCPVEAGGLPCSRSVWGVSPRRGFWTAARLPNIVPEWRWLHQHWLFPAAKALLAATCGFPDGSGGWKAVAVTLGLPKIVLFSLWFFQGVWCLCWFGEVKGSFWVSNQESSPRLLANKGWLCAETAAHLCAHRRRLFCYSFTLSACKAKISSQLS